MANESAGGQAGTGSFTPLQIRLLKIAVVGMGVFIVVALAAIIGRLLYLASGRASQVTVATPAVADTRLPLPAGAVIRNIAVSADRLAVHYDTPAGAGIAILDLAGGRPALRVGIVPDVPR